jgi:YVTN family beta-propeller protein
MSTLISWKIKPILYVLTISLLLTIGPASGLAQPLQAAAPEAGLPLLFVENVGQFAAAGDGEIVQFVVQGDQTSLRVTDRALWFTHLTPPGPAAAEVQALDDPTRSGLNLRLAFVDANPQPRIEPFNRLATRVSYFRGSDPAGWQTNVPVWGGVRYVDLYPGLDLELSGENGQLALRWVVKPEAAGSSLLEGVRFQVAGAETLALTGAGQLRLATALGERTLPLPYLVDAGGAPLDASVHPAIDGLEIVAPVGQQPPPASDLMGVAAAGDLLFSTYLGGSGGEDVKGLAVDGAGSAYVTGFVNSADFPTTPGAIDDSRNYFDSYVAKLNPAGTVLEYATYLGGDSGEMSYDLAVDEAGQAYVTGYTRSPDFPVTPGAYKTAVTGLTDAFVTKFNPTGDGLIFSTFIGGSYLEWGYGLALDGAGSVYLTGTTTSADLPTTPGAFQPTAGGLAGYYDTFVVKLNSAGSAVEYSTYLGGADSDHGEDIAVDSEGQAYVTGETESTNFPVTPGAFQTNFRRLFVTKFNASGSNLVYSTFLGGNSSEEALAIAVDGTGHAFVAGYTTSTNFPTTPGAFQTDYHSGSSVTREGDIFVVKFNPAGSGLVYGTYVGGTDRELAFGLHVDSQGRAYVAGSTYSTDLPVTPDAFQPARSGYPDAYLAKLNAAGSALIYGTYLGGSRHETAYALAADELGQAYIAGSTTSPDFPTSAGAYDTTFDGTYSDGFVTKLDTGNEAEPGPEPVPAHTCAPTPLGTITVGNEPRGLAVDSPRQRVYVANYGSNSLSVIDSHTNTVLQTIGGLTAATEVGLDPGRNVIWVTNYSTNQVTPIQANAGATDFTVLPAVEVGEGPWGVAYDPVHDYVYVANSLSDSVTVIEAGTRTEVTTLGDAFYSPFHLAANSVTGKIYVANFAAASVTVVEGDTVSRVVSLYDSGEPYGLAVDQVRNLVYVATVGPHRIVVIGPANGQPDQLRGWAAFNRGFGDPNRPVPMRVIAVNPAIGPFGDGGHVWSTTSTADGSEADQALFIPKGWWSYFHMPFAQNVATNPADGIAIDRATNRVYVAGGVAPGSVTVVGDHATLCPDAWARIASNEAPTGPDDERIGLEIFEADDAGLSRPGDVNGDGAVNMLDLIRVATHFDTDTPEVDLNGDGRVDVVDLVIVASNFD